MRKQLLALSWLFLSMCTMSFAQNASDIDLTVTELSRIDTASSVSDSIVIKLCVKNNGNLPFAQLGSIAYYLSTDTILNKNGDNPLTSHLIDYLAPGESICYTETISLLDEYIQRPGVYYLIASIDHYNQVSELREDNNTKAVGPISIVVRDFKLQLDSLTIDRDSILERKYFNSSVVVRNLGSVTSDLFYVDLYLSSDSNLEFTDWRTGGTDYYDSERIDGNTSIRLSYDCSTNLHTPPGNYYLIAVVGDYDASYPRHDTVIIPVQIRPSESNKDIRLRMDSLYANKTVLKHNEKFSLTAAITNIGTKLWENHEVHFYLSKDSLYDTSDLWIIGVFSQPALHPGTSALFVSDNCEILEQTTPGRYYILARSVNIKGEIIPSGNAKILVKLEKPDEQPNVDLSILSVSGNLTVVSNSNRLAITVTEKNLGNFVAGNHMIAYYLSSDTSWSTNDLSIGSLAMASIAGGATLTNSSALYLPDGINGSYYLIAKTNPTGAITETNTSNNTKASLFPIEITSPYVDLYLSSFMISKTQLQIGEGLGVHAVVKNLGTSNAGGFFIDYIISDDTILNNGNDRYIGNIVPSGLLAGDSLVDDQYLSITDAISSGNYYVIATVNYDELVSETDRSNNTIIIPISIGVITGVSSAKLNDQVTIFPNPSTGAVHIRNINAENIDINIYDLSNKLVHSEHATLPETNLSLPNGFYVVKISSGNRSLLTQKLIINK